jgi:hypothetical protein
MDFRAHRPQRGFGRSERSLAKIAEDLTRFLTKAQRSLTYDTLHLSGRQRETLASVLYLQPADNYLVPKTGYNAPLSRYGNSVRLNFCLAVELSDASGQYERSIPLPWPIH